MKVQNNMSSTYGSNLKNNKAITFTGTASSLEKASNNFLNAMSKEKDTKKLMGVTKSMIAKSGEIIKDAAKKANPEKPSFIYKAFEGLSSKMSKAKWFNYLVENKDGLAYALVLGNTAKELMGTTIYTVQAFTNEDLPKDKRKFIGAYDLAVGLTSTALGLAFGLATVKGQSKLINAIIGGDKAKNLGGYAKAISGFTFMIPLVIQNILIKRVIAPSVATPIAGELKNKMEAKEKAEQEAKMSAFPKEALVLAKTDDDKAKLNTKA